MKTATLGTLLLLLFVSGCARFAYQPASGDNTASVTFSSDGIGVQPMICVPGKGFKATEISVASNDSDSEFVTQVNEALKKQPEVTTLVPGDNDTRVGFSYAEDKKAAGTRERCKVAVFFRARAGAHYRAHFSLPGGQCALTLTSEDDAAVDAVAVPYTCP